MNSQIFLAPDDGVGVMAFTNRIQERASRLKGEMEQLLRDLIGAPREGIRSDVPQHPEIWASSGGRYRPARPADRHAGVEHPRRRS